LSSAINHDDKTGNISSAIVSDVMSRSLVTLLSKSTMCDVAKKMSECKVSSVFLTIDEASTSDPNSGNQRIVGIVTQTDLAEVCVKDILASEVIADSVMSSVISISEDAKVEEAAQVMLDKRIRHLAVRERNDSGRILGIISSTNLAQYLKRRITNDGNARQYLGEELTVVNALSIPEPIPFGNQDEQC
jgi:CBS domain-containing protein